MDRFARVVLGYHGCDEALAASLLAGETPVEDWQPSRNSYDWLGHGVYFWEHAPERARVWAHQGGKSGVIGAVIQLGRCLDLTDIRYTELLGLSYQSIARSYLDRGVPLPKNSAKLRKLDCLVVNELIRDAEQTSGAIQTVRCPFLEGEPAFPGAGILKESHIQIAVVDRSCILGVFRPNLDLRKVGLDGEETQPGG